MDNAPLRFRVRDLPVQGREVIDLSASLIAADQALRNDGNRVIAVANHGCLIGTVSRADLDSFHRTQHATEPAESMAVHGVDHVMNLRVVLCDPDETADEVLRRCALVDARFVLSVDQSNRLHGVLSRDDLQDAINNLRDDTKQADPTASS